MGFFSFDFLRPKTLARLVLASALLSGTSLLVSGQTVSPGGVKKTSPNTPATQVESSSTRTNVNETFELNMDERRYSQESFEAATAVETKDSGANLNVQIGVALASGRIDVLLRNVHGRVSFRGSLNRIVEIINNRQATSPSPPAPSSGPVAPPSP